MPTVTYINHDGSQTTVEGDVGDSVMSTAVDAGIEGILAECGGGCACATCHCYVDPEWYERVGAPEGIEEDMLEMTESPREATSRLSCQIELTEALDGLIVRLPESQ